MASQNTPQSWTYDPQYQRYQRIIWDYTQQIWVFAEWMPVGFLPPQQTQSPPPQSQPTTVTTPQAYTAQTSTYQYTYNKQQRSDSVTSPGQNARAASAGPAAAYAPSYDGLAQQLYGTGSSAQSSSQKASWPSSSSNYHQSGQQYGASTGQPAYLQSGNSMHNNPTFDHGGRMLPKGTGQSVNGTYRPGMNNKKERVDPSFYVRDRKFFQEGRVLAVILTETAGDNSTTGLDATDYNSSKSITTVKYKDNFVYTNVRRFVVVRAKREFCYGIPIFTYNGRATTKPGVRPAEHGIIYSVGQAPQLLRGEVGITKPSIAVEMTKGVRDLQVASRIYYGIMHPIQYNVKVKSIGLVPKEYISALIGNWKAEDDKDAGQSMDVTQGIPEEPEEEEEEELEYEEEEDDENVDTEGNGEVYEYEDNTAQSPPSGAPDISQDVASVTYSISQMKRPSQG